MLCYFLMIDRFEGCYLKTIGIDEKYRTLFMHFDQTITRITKVFRNKVWLAFYFNESEVCIKEIQGAGTIRNASNMPPMRMKGWVYMTCIRSCLLYGCKT